MRPSDRRLLLGQALHGAHLTEQSRRARVARRDGLGLFVICRQRHVVLLAGDGQLVFGLLLVDLGCAGRGVRARAVGGGEVILCLQQLGGRLVVCRLRSAQLRLGGLGARTFARDAGASFDLAGAGPRELALVEQTRLVDDRLLLGELGGELVDGRLRGCRLGGGRRRARHDAGRGLILQFGEPFAGCVQRLRLGPVGDRRLVFERLHHIGRVHLARDVVLEDLQHERFGDDDADQRGHDHARERETEQTPRIARGGHRRGEEPVEVEDDEGPYDRQRHGDPHDHLHAGQEREEHRQRRDDGGAEQHEEHLHEARGLGRHVVEDVAVCAAEDRQAS